MKIVRRIGTTQLSVDLSGEPADPDYQPIRRWIELKPTSIPGEAEASAGAGAEILRKEDLVEFMTTDPGVLVAFAISALDLVYRKPKTNNLMEMRPEWYNARARLGADLWAALLAGVSPEARNALLAKSGDNDTGKCWSEEWSWKVHPYKKGKDCRAQIEDNITKLKKDKQNENEWKQKNASRRLKNIESSLYSGRWFFAFTGIENPAKKAKEFDALVENLDTKVVARRIVDHLLKEELRIGDGDKKQQSSVVDQGRIQRCARRLMKSAPKVIHPQPLTFEWGAAEVKRYRGAWIKDPTGKSNDIAASIVDIAFQRSEEKSTIRRNDIAEALNAYFVVIMPSDATPSIEGPKCDFDKLKKLHLRVRNFYKELTLTKKFQKAARTKNMDALRRQLPKNFDALMGMIALQDENRYVNALIRRGKALHYARIGAVVDPKREATCYTVEGQATIKRVESLARKFRSVLVHAHRTVAVITRPTNDLGIELPNGQINHDLFHQKVRQKATNINADSGPGFDECRYTRSLALIFGDPGKEFIGSTAENAEILKALLEIGRTYRNLGYHFTARSNLVDALTKSDILKEFKPLVRDKINALYVSDFQGRIARLDEELRSFSVGRFFKLEEINALRSILRDREADVDFTLPRFNRVISRNHHHRENDVFKNKDDVRNFLPTPPNTRSMNVPAALCKYGVMKSLYERSFPKWLNEGGAQERLRQWFDTAKKGMTERAVDNFADADKKMAVRIVSKAEQNLHFKEDLTKSMREWDRVLTTETRDQATYQDNPEAVREKSEWVENIKLDLFAKAFSEFLKDKNLNWLWQHAEDATPVRVEIEFGDDEKPSPPDFVQWQSNLYFFLHLVPLGEASEFLHQLKKSETLEDKSIKRANIEPPSVAEDLGKIKQVISLYLDMAEAKFSNTSNEQALKPFTTLFETPKNFDDLFNQPASEDHQSDYLQDNMRRGLRNILRVGDEGFLMEVLAADDQAKVRDQDVQELQTTEGKTGRESIDAAHEKREELHKKYEKNHKTFKASKEYAGLIKKISEHRRLAAQVRLTNHLNAYQLVVRSAARLLQYAATYERDALYISHAIAEQEGWHQDFMDHLVQLDKDGTLLRPRNLRKFFFEAQEANGQKRMDAMKSAANTKILTGLFDDRRIKIFNRLEHLKLFEREGRPRVFKFDLTKEINDVRFLMDYDRKEKNNVSKSIKRILEMSGVRIEWSIVKDDAARHNLKIKRIDSQKIVHLKKLVQKNRVYEGRHGEPFLHMINKAFGGA